MFPATKLKSAYFVLCLVCTICVLLILLLVLNSRYDFFIKYSFSIFALSLISFLFYFYYLNTRSTKPNINKIPNFILNYALDSVTDHVIVTDTKAIVLYANKRVEDITGFQLNEIIGKKAGSSDNWGGLMPKEFYKKMWNTLVKDRVFVGTVKNKRKNGEEYESFISVYPIKEEGILKYFVSIERDITHEKELDRMKTDFISLASHQLRTPLSAMKWYLEMLLDGDAGKLTDEQQSYLRNIDGSNERMIELVNSLLNISRVESGRLIVDPKDTSIIDVVEDVISDVKPKAKERGITFIFEGVPSLPTIISDPKLMRNVYMNLLTNAIKYTPSGGFVSLKVSKTATDIISEITDTGMGIPKKDHDKIFTRFFRAENARGKVTDGNGLGLYLVKAVIEVCGGKIWFKSVEGKGTTFTFSLPLKGIPAKKGEVTIDQ